MPDWSQALKGAAQYRSTPINAVTFRRRWPSASSPVLLLCDDGKEYVVKGRHAGRQIVNDHIVAHLGAALGAPVGKPSLVIIPTELQQSEPQMAGITPGISHASLWIQGCSERIDGVTCDEPENADRFCKLSVLFGWCQGSDQQFIYSNQPPRLVYSVDHGHFFPTGPEWKIEHLQNANAPRPDQRILGACPGIRISLQQNYDCLKALDDEVILRAVSAPPDEWGLAMEERTALVQYLIDRRKAFQLG